MLHFLSCSCDPMVDYDISPVVETPLSLWLRDCYISFFFQTVDDNLLMDYEIELVPLHHHLKNRSKKENIIVVFIGKFVK